jgi:hypothetical protein
MFARALLLLLLSLSASPAYAYHLDDHQRITLQAVQELNACFPGLISHANETALWMSDLEEDVDIIRKEFLYSHYFNPYKHLDMRRYDSSVRVERLQSDLEQDEAEGDRSGLDVFTHLGHLVHHLQDMSVPAHVVPVMHGLEDGFEKYDLKGDISSGLSCADLITHPVSDLSTLLVDTAKQTLSSVSSLSVQIMTAAGTASQEVTVRGDDFWQAASDDSFGKYGTLGNHFGETSFVENGTTYAVPIDFYADYKQQQMKSGARATLEALYWFLVLR